MTLQVKPMPRIFVFEDVEYEDPNPNWDTKQVLNHLADVVDPKITNSNLSGPEIKNEKLVYTVNATVGRKG